MKILTIEDDVVLRDGINEILVRAGYETVQASMGSEGLKMALEKRPDLILLDIMMPGMNGFDVLKHLREHQQTATTPVIMVTALGSRNNYRDGMDLGADDFIVKPFTRNELLQAIESRLSRKNLFNELKETAVRETNMRILRTIPHELRTPLNGLMGYGQLLASDPDCFSRDELVSAGKDIYASALRLNRLVERYLLFIQLELKLGNWERVSQPFPVYASLKQKAFEVADRYDRLKDLYFSGNAVTTRLPLMLLQQLCDELLDNAFKFSKVGDQVVFSFDVEDERLKLEIEDQGPGFTKEQYSKVSPFVKFNLNFRSNEGSGLGLSIVQRLLTDIDGRLQIIPKKTQGTIIRVLL